MMANGQCAMVRLLCSGRPPGHCAPCMHHAAAIRCFNLHRVLRQAFSPTHQYSPAWLCFAFLECKTSGYCFSAQRAAESFVDHYASCVTDQLPEPLRSAAAADVKQVLLGQLATQTSRAKDIGGAAFLKAACNIAEPGGRAPRGRKREDGEGGTFIGRDPGEGQMLSNASFLGGFIGRDPGEGRMLSNASFLGGFIGRDPGEGHMLSYTSIS